ncbi:MAG: Mechanosensitive ion channel protein MscS [Pedobacter sp.]|nr:Mechanosensitive ion channel protein MscS [Pedobacter sp.]
MSLQNIIVALIAIVLGLMFKFLVRRAFSLAYRFSDYYLLKSVANRLNRSFGFFVPLVLLTISLGFMTLSPELRQHLSRILQIGLTINFAFLLINFLSVLEDVFYHTYDPNKENNLRERKLRTQLGFIRKFIVSLIILITISSILLSFESMRQIGKNLLTGVGIGGIIIGFAAQKSLGSLLAGFQIAFTQPIRIDDVLVVEGEWGRVEEITLTYVVLGIWDQRRLILPITYFIEKPFQNWTRTSSELLGTVHLNLDYTVPIDPIRTELTRVLNSTDLWDKRVNVVHVTDNKESTLEVRLLISAANAGNMWELRCFVRENIIAFINNNYPDSFPRTRVNLQGTS